MNEYIKREDALKEAQSDVIGEDEFAGYKDFILVKDLNAIPAADVVERSDNLVKVVRCKECNLAGTDVHGVCYCELFNSSVGENFFCYAGTLNKRKDGDDHD